MHKSTRNAGEGDWQSNCRRPDPHVREVTHLVRVAAAEKQNFWMRWLDSHRSELYQQSNGCGNAKGGQSKQGWQREQSFEPLWA